MSNSSSITSFSSYLSDLTTQYSYLFYTKLLSDNTIMSSVYGYKDSDSSNPYLIIKGFNSSEAEFSANLNYSTATRNAGISSLWAKTKNAWGRYRGKVSRSLEFIKNDLKNIVTENNNAFFKYDRRVDAVKSVNISDYYKKFTGVSYIISPIYISLRLLTISSNHDVRTIASNIFKTLTPKSTYGLKSAGAGDDRDTKGYYIYDYPVNNYTPNPVEENKLSIYDFTEKDFRLFTIITPTITYFNMMPSRIVIKYSDSIIKDSNLTSKSSEEKSCYTPLYVDINLEFIPNTELTKKRLLYNMTGDINEATEDTDELSEDDVLFCNTSSCTGNLTTCSSDKS